MTTSKETSTTKSRILCAYCHEASEDTPEAIRDHVIDCKQRPEYGLLLKIDLLEAMGDEVLAVLHEFAKAIAAYDGGLTGVWEIYRAEQERWSIAKNTEATDLVASEILREQKEKEEERKD